MARRLPSQPPVLPGFSFVHILGSGGFADVFLYEQNMPRRQVAVKVLLNEVVNENVRQMFQAEANLMGQVSAHPSVLTVHSAGVSADGRPYLVMELCSAMLSERYRRERIPVPEILRVAVAIGSAIETAHRTGVLHRDIKPSNILLTAYGHPVLSDFGIASTLSTDTIEESIGLSIPWSAPEVLLDETTGTVASEVWAFAATIYSLLAGRSPFEIPDGANSSADLMGRINRAKPQPIGRPDVPASLEQALRRAMSRRPEQRPSSVIEVVRELQLVESELGVAQTPIELAMDEWALSTAGDLGERTRLRAAPGAAAPVKEGRRRRRAAAALGGVDEAPANRSAPRESGGAIPSSGRSGVGSRRGANGWLIATIAALVAVIGVIVGVLVYSTQDAQSIPRVADIRDTQSNGTVRFSWDDPGLGSGDRYSVAVDDDTPSFQQANSFKVDAAPGATVCITVTVNRGGRAGEPSSTKCVDIVAG
ncbi:serine/threonine-protein kinase [Schumannella soli]|uniref:non-specific serine/threonine protein kinase n=1 Tax=Schumannella soli TaxID=2590779 RepID=A0A506Y6H4_9MICO|nr:serine/threonine-protein kinase [Schumannella soli]TPW75999.1 serine/threonine protein kinase [Schumannella soli]